VLRQEAGCPPCVAAAAGCDRVRRSAVEGSSRNLPCGRARRGPCWCGEHARIHLTGGFSHPADSLIHAGTRKRPLDRGPMSPISESRNRSQRETSSEEAAGGFRWDR